MAINDDTFWAEQAPAAAEGPYLPGLRLHRAEGESNRFGFVTTAALLGAAVLLIVLWYLINWSPVLPGLLMLIGIGALVAAPAICGASARYRLLDDNSYTPEFDGEPEHLPALLEKLGASELLRARLTPPEVGESSPSAFWTLFPAPDGVRPVAVIAFWGFVLGQSLVVADGFIVRGQYASLELLSLASLAVLLISIGWMYNRVRTGVCRLGTGDPFADRQRPPMQFRDASAAALRWDPFLGKPYLLLHLKGKSIRYYSPTQEPLHLLQVARYRMPHLELQV